MRKGRDGGKKREGNRERREKTDGNSGHYVIASSRPPERQPLERRTPHARANFAKLQSLHFETCYLRTYRCPDMWASWAVAAKNQTKKYLCLDEWQAIVSDQHLFPLSFKSFSKSHISLKFGYFYPNFCMWSRIIPYKLLIAIGGQIWLH